MKIKLSEIRKARKELTRFLLPSPLMYNSWISESMGCEVYLKLENTQPIGSFKIRGATYKMTKLTESQRRRGVIAASAGNHAQGVAWGAKKLGISALIVMPCNAPIIKFQNTVALGAEVVLFGENYDASYARAKEIASETGRYFIHAFEDDEVIAGQATVGLEILDQLPDVDVIIGSVGGGGLMAGVGSAVKALRPECRLIGCQALEASSMIRSIESGKAVRLSTAYTFADGVAIKQASEKVRKILSSLIDDWISADDEAIAAAILTLMERAKVVTEGAGALPFVALEKMRGELRGKKVVLIVSGGNIDVNLLSRIIDLGLIKSGRRLRLNILLTDRPGSLARLTAFIAKLGANVLQAIHDRSEPFTHLDQANIAFTLETRGPAHSAEVIRALQKKVLRLEQVL